MSSRTTIRISLPVEPADTAPPWPFLRWLEWLLSAYIRLHEQQRQRRQLLELDGHLLDDIGVTREQARAVGNKRFWDA